MARQRRAWQRGMDRAGAMGSEHHRAKLPMYARIILHPLMGLLLLHLQSLMPELRCRQTAARSTRCGRAVCTSPAGSTAGWCRRTHAARRAERWCMSPIGPQPSTMS